MSEINIETNNLELAAIQGGGTVNVTPPPMTFTLIPTTETTQFSNALAVPASANSEASAVKTTAWYCGNCLAPKQIWLNWSALPTSGAQYFMKVQWCPWDSSQDADWVEDDSIGVVTVSDTATSTRLLIPVSRYGTYLRLRVWQTAGAPRTLDAFGMGKWS